EPVVGGAAPPLGAGIETGIRETRVPLPAGATACFFTDGLVEARVNGGLVGRAKLTEMLSELGDSNTARDLLHKLAQSTQRAPDDMAACIIRAVEGTPVSSARLDVLEVRAGDDWARHARAFLRGAGIDDESAVEELLRSARLRAAEFGAALLRVTVDRGETTADVAEPDMSGMTVLPPVRPDDASIAF
ncbi:MAG: SpoIIE family protein phosphatase, partial [Thermoleophilaceae bacterium]